MKRYKMQHLKGYTDKMGYCRFDDYGHTPLASIRVITPIHPEITSGRIVNLILFNRSFRVW